VSTALSYLSRWLFIRILQLQMGRSSGCWCIWIFQEKGIFDKEVATKFKENILLKEEQNTQWLYTNVLEVKNLSLMLC
jgi:hypothetical protein